MHRRAFISGIVAAPVAAGLAYRFRPSGGDSAPDVQPVPLAPTGGWTLRGDTARSGIIPSLGWAPTPATRWDVDLGESIDVPPAVNDGVVYAVSGTAGAGVLVALDAASGAEQWRFATGGYMQSTPTVDDVAVYVGCNDGNLYSVDIATGAERWRFTASGPVYGSPAVVDGTVFAVSDDTFVYALDATTGQEKWRFNRKFGAAGTPAVVNGLVYVGGGDLEKDEPSLFALDAVTGKKRWQAKLGSWVITAPVVADGVVYAGSSVFFSESFQFGAFDAASGDKHWIRTYDGSIGAAPLIADGVVYLADSSHNLMAIDLASGEERWRYDAFAGGSLITDPYSPILIGGAIYVPSNRATGSGVGNGIVALDPASGQPLLSWAAPNPGATLTAPMILDGVAFVGANDGHLYAIG